MAGLNSSHLSHSQGWLHRYTLTSLKNVSNPAQRRIAWLCHSKIAGNMNREAISEHSARAGRETIPARVM
jgi:hypothetical protein